MTWQTEQVYLIFNCQTHDSEGQVRIVSVEYQKQRVRQMFCIRYKQLFQVIEKAIFIGPPGFSSIEDCTFNNVTGTPLGI